MLQTSRNFDSEKAPIVRIQSGLGSILNLKSVVLRMGFEPTIFAVRGRCPKPLDDRSTLSEPIFYHTHP